MGKGDLHADYGDAKEPSWSEGCVPEMTRCQVCMIHCSLLLGTLRCYSQSFFILCLCLQAKCRSRLARWTEQAAARFDDLSSIYALLCKLQFGSYHTQLAEHLVRIWGGRRKGRTTAASRSSAAYSLLPSSFSASASFSACSRQV